MKLKRECESPASSFRDTLYAHSHNLGRPGVTVNSHLEKDSREVEA